MKGMPPKEIHEEMVHTLAEDSHSYATVKMLAVDFKRERNSTENDPWLTLQRPQQQVNMLMPFTMRFEMSGFIFQHVNISSGSVPTISTRILRTSMLFTRHGPRMLTQEQKLKRVDISWTLSRI